MAIGKLIFIIFGVNAMTRLNKKISRNNLEDELLSIILGYHATEAQKDFTDQVNNRIIKLENNKQNKADMQNYFSKSENIPKSNLDSDYVKKIDDHIEHKIDFNDLDTTLSSRISNYEDRSKTALSNTVTLQSLLNTTKAQLSTVQIDIANIYNQISSLQTLTNTNSSGAQDEQAIKTLQNQISSLSSSATDLYSKIDIINTQLSGVPSSSDIDNLKDLVNSLKEELNNTASVVPIGFEGQNVVLGKSNSFENTEMIIVGEAINTDGIATTSCSAEANNDNTKSYLDFAANEAYILKQNTSTGDGNARNWMDDAYTSEIIIGDATYGVVQNAFTSWFGNNKFILSYSTGVFGYVADNEYTIISSLNSVNDELNKIKDSITKNINDITQNTNNITNNTNKISNVATSVNTIASILNVSSGLNSDGTLDNSAPGTSQSTNAISDINQKLDDIKTRLDTVEEKISKTEGSA